MYFYYKKTKIFYDIQGSGDAVVCLHGWQSSSDAFALIGEELKFQYKIIFIDLPPFGKGGKLKFAWSLNDYSDMVYQLLSSLKIQNFHILAHSFGGRVAINLCTCYNCNVKKLILTGSAGLKPRRSIGYYFKVCRYKIYKKKLLKKGDDAKIIQGNFGSEDFKKLDDIMRQTFVKIVNFHQDKYLKKIQCPTLLIFGKDDKETPVYMAKRFKKLIKNSKLTIFDDCGHFCFINKSEQFFDLVNNFLGKET